MLSQIEEKSSWSHVNEGLSSEKESNWREKKNFLQGRGRVLLVLLKSKVNR